MCTGARLAQCMSVSVCVCVCTFVYWIKVAVLACFFCYCLDVSDIKFVINFDFPGNTEDYVHRIGRTARAKNTGTAYTFFTKNNAKQAKDLIEIMREAKQQIPPRLYEMIDLAKQHTQYKRKQLDWNVRL